MIKLQWPPLLINNLYYVTLIFIFFIVHFILIKPVLSDHCIMWPYFTVPYDGHIRQVWLYTQNSKIITNS
jgi:antibiotic biosynthesis monooxygenase (ABM) superfamily enzyme